MFKKHLKTANVKYNNQLHIGWCLNCQACMIITLAFFAELGIEQLFYRPVQFAQTLFSSTHASYHTGVNLVICFKAKVVTVFNCRIIYSVYYFL